MKECPRCHQILPESSFSKDKSKKDGLSCYCRKCKSEHHREYVSERLKNNLCYDCGKPVPNGKRYCFECYQKRLELNKVYEKERVGKGLCRQCGKNPIDYSRSVLHCSDCLDKRNR